MKRLDPFPTAGDLGQALQAAPADASAHDQLVQLVRRGLDRLPLPGSGATLARWQALAAVAAHDLSLAKLYEGHTDALSVLQELRAPALGADEDATWGMWAAEAPGHRVEVRVDADGRATLHGRKAWCSGAASASHGLLTAWRSDPHPRGPQLVAVPMRQPGVAVSDTAWAAVGMAASASLDITFDGANAELVGQPGDYLARAGFWQGGAGVAACWYGGTLPIAAALHRAVASTPPDARSPFRLAALGKVDLAMRGTAALLREAAAWTDAHPTADAAAVALRVRQAAESGARLVLDEVGRALGATPFCRDAGFARAAADLPVFIRQSHAERDFAALGERLVAGTAAADVTAVTFGREGVPWQL
ncbi:MAG: acyl-CoA dehydrogenase [Rhodoferax sp.]|nr:acyl-CoA dehydrogenase [Rhodoferax sp.]